MGLFDGIIGSVVSGIGGVIQNNSNQEFAAEQAQMNRDFQMQMSNTAYQRGMADMKAAGLNPILAYQKGPASSPTGATAATSVTNVGQAMVDSYNNSARTAADNARTEAETTKLAPATELVKQELENAKETQAQIRANTALAVGQTEKAIAEAKYVGTQTQGAASTNTAKAVDSSYYESTFGKGSRYIGNFLNEINPLKGLIGGAAR